MHVVQNTFCSVSLLTRAIVVQQSHNKLYNWHADSSRRSIVQLSRERTTPRISSWTSLKCYVHFSFILKLIIFIYKQLKRPVAFSVVQNDEIWCQQFQKSGQVWLQSRSRKAAINCWVVFTDCTDAHQLLAWARLIINKFSMDKFPDQKHDLQHIRNDHIGCGQGKRQCILWHLEKGNQCSSTCLLLWVEEWDRCVCCLCFHCLSKQQSMSETGVMTT